MLEGVVSSRCLLRAVQRDHVSIGCRLTLALLEGTPQMPTRSPFLPQPSLRYSCALFSGRLSLCEENSNAKKNAPPTPTSCAYLPFLQLTLSPPQDSSSALSPNSSPRPPFSRWVNSSLPKRASNPLRPASHRHSRSSCFYAARVAPFALSNDC